MTARSDSYYAKHIEPLEYTDWLGEQEYLASLDSEPQARRRDVGDDDAERDPIERGSALARDWFDDGWVS